MPSLLVLLEGSWWGLYGLFVAATYFRHSAKHVNGDVTFSTRWAVTRRSTAQRVPGHAIVLRGVTTVALFVRDMLRVEGCFDASHLFECAHQTEKISVVASDGIAFERIDIIYHHPW
jgi:hypothetical protein